jgi:hypothetical protein
MCDCDCKECRVATKMFGVETHENHKCEKIGAKAS